MNDQPISAEQPSRPKTLAELKLEDARRALAGLPAGSSPARGRTLVQQAIGINPGYLPHCGQRERDRWLRQQARLQAKALARVDAQRMAEDTLL